MNHELWWDLLVLELLKHDTDDHEILDVVWSNDEAGRWYFLHRSGGYDGDGVVRELRSDRTSPNFLITCTQNFVAATMARPSVKRPNQGVQVTF
jgi:hypothetical protein